MADYQRRSIYVGDIKSHFLEAGSGPYLVLLHGGEYGASAEITWRHNIDALAKRFHVIAPDMLGWGSTDKIYNFSDPAGYRIRHIKRLLEILGVAKAFFVGNSAGGGTILRASVLDPIPFQIQKMVTICGNASVFKTVSQGDLENHTPSLENMGKIVKLLFRTPGGSHRATSRSATTLPSLPVHGKPFPPRGLEARHTRHVRRPKNSSRSLRSSRFRSCSCPASTIR
jgi:2-hydroxymuconate-semialdehyde hydrolase